MSRRDGMAERINFVIQETPFEKLSPELWQRIQAGVVKVGDYHDEDTLMKAAESIREALRETLGPGAEEVYILRKAAEIIGAMQNKGILFRERDK